MIMMPGGTIVLPGFFVCRGWCADVYTEIRIGALSCRQVWGSGRQVQLRCCSNLGVVRDALADQPADYSKWRGGLSVGVGDYRYME